MTCTSGRTDLHRRRIRSLVRRHGQLRHHYLGAQRFGLDRHPPDGAEEGWHYLSSSKILYNGYWVTKNIYFRDTYDYPDTAPGPRLPHYIRTRAPILVVTRKYVCKEYDIDVAGKDCLGDPYSTEDNPRGIFILGSGFGRTHDGQPQGTPNKNPLLHVTSFRGRTRAVPPSSTDNYWPGYIISKEGITVGLTETNTASMSFV
ncbi:hypothetical protein N657DRAFT_645683 [Parathielavia appendiculata]|uniref:Uncharacterized protein n=1 Tax=Parathielavia appendiculata TaxID=2587402 RepID=A0AAN6Z303_9PEZI|nr:hypothetical protein N657DRAFT_645683 [Parathielavia appendiculata]